MLVDEIKRYYEAEKKIIDNLDMEELGKAVQAVIDAYMREAAIYIFGNGGSAATASHYANDFNKGISEKLDRKFNMVCLCDNFSTVTAIANDISYDEIFRFQLRNKLKKSDLVIAISGSGNSRNVINAVDYAKEVGAQTIGISGYRGGMLRELTDFHMHCPIEDMQITEDIHMTFDHMMYRVISDYLDLKFEEGDSNQTKK